MSGITAKEKNMLLVIIVLVLYAVAALFYRKQKVEWTKQANVLKNARRKYARERALIAATSEWDEKYTTMRSLMPVFPYEQDVATHWLNLMDTVASQNKLSISRRQIGKEEEVGDVFELPLECKNWEGTLESLVRFLYGLHKEGAMLDVRQLFMRSAGQPGYLKGTFSLYCAYMRDDVVEAAPASESTVVRKPASAKERALSKVNAPAAPRPDPTDVEPAVSVNTPTESVVEPAIPGDEAAAPRPRKPARIAPAEEGAMKDEAAQKKLERTAVEAALKELKEKL